MPKDAPFRNCCRSELLNPCSAISGVGADPVAARKRRYVERITRLSPPHGIVERAEQLVGQPSFMRGEAEVGADFGAKGFTSREDVREHSVGRELQRPATLLNLFEQVVDFGIGDEVHRRAV
ncbi:hypothetical protein [Amycolatopsis sp. NPDC051371]|uniref:hypothetical protein n=1 Tax=Amycolatopsis sp. NPDC051371 TaxID=3155800 RepID=UPI0034444208